MTGVVELLATAGESAPVQRVRNYHLTDRAASPRARDFLTAMRRSGGGLCLRWAGPDGNRFVRYADPDWECAEYDSVRGRQAVNALDPDRLRKWLRETPPELVAYDEIRGAFEESAVRASPAETVATDGGPNPNEPVRVERYLDLLADPELDRRDADALAGALPAGSGEVAFRLPLALAEEIALESVAGSDCVFVAEPVADRETERARYLRQGSRGALVPTHEARFYELAEGATVDRDESGPGATGSP